MACFHHLAEMAAAIGGRIVRAAQYVVAKVSAIALRCVKVGIAAVCCVADAVVGAPVGTTALAVKVCISVTKTLAAPSGAAAERELNGSPETQPEPDTQGHACEKTWEDGLDELAVGILSTLATMALLKGVKSAGALAKRARSSLLQPIWSVTRDTSLTPWVPVSVRATR
jgi:hypothetical protein